jgi:hypothetical protein
MNKKYKTCNNCLWTQCSLFTKVFCTLTNKRDWRSKYQPDNFVHSLPKTKLNIPMPECKPAKDENKKESEENL